jgi:galactoside O-acetyltransferase
MSAPATRRQLRFAALARAALSPSNLLGFVYTACVRWSFRSCGRGLRLRLTTSIRGHRNIAIGNNFVSMGQLYLYATDGGCLQIGDDCAVNTNVQLGASPGRIVVGDGVMIGPNVVVRAADHGVRRDFPMRYQAHIGGEIVIEDDVWIGSNAVVTANVTLARGTIVAAGAVVTCSTEPYSIVAGVPARKIGERT